MTQFICLVLTVISFNLAFCADKEGSAAVERSPVSSTVQTLGKHESMEPFRAPADAEFLTTNQGVRISDPHNSLKTGPRGPTLLEDFIMREKITHFDHERIPERVVHARGNGAHGIFKVYEPMAEYTKAGFLQDPSVETPVFVRFSTVGGSRGSADTPRDVRGFAVKFYTSEGNFDLVGNNMPVFFIQDAIKFPDLIHAVKPEPHNEIPQASSAHDTFYDFITLTPESTHMMMWLMSDRALPRSQRMMEGFGVHTFRFINEAGVSSFVKFHWKPLLGVHSLAWDESQKLAGKDPDFLRRDLWEAIENGDFPEWELGVQIISAEDEHEFGFDLLDPTKLIPEELVPVRRIGKMTLNRNPDNFFAEVEQVVFHIGHIVPGIDFTNDPLLQGRLFSYTDTQLLRLGGANFHEIPINRPVCPFSNHQRDGMHRQTIVPGRVAYDRNSLNSGLPARASIKEGGFVSYPERVDALKVRARSASFGDYFSQATLFYNSQSDPEKQHIIEAYQFELAKVETPVIRERMVGLLAHVDSDLAARVASTLAIDVAAAKEEAAKQVQLAKKMVGEIALAESSTRKYTDVPASAALSMVNAPKTSIKTRKIAFLATDGVDAPAITSMKEALTAQGAMVKVLAPHLGTVETIAGDLVPVDYVMVTHPSIMFDAVYVPGGRASVEALKSNSDAVCFIAEAFKHCKAIAACNEGAELLAEARIKIADDPAVIIGDTTISDDFIAAIMQHRNWARF